MVTTRCDSKPIVVTIVWMRNEPGEHSMQLSNSPKVVIVTMYWLAEFRITDD